MTSFLEKRSRAIDNAFLLEVILILLGIPNCDSVKKGKKWLETQKVAFSFRDIRKEPLSQIEWENLLQQDVDDVLINTKGTTFRKLKPDLKTLNLEQKAALLEANPSLMKRPVLLENGAIQAIGLKHPFFST